MPQDKTKEKKPKKAQDMNLISVLQGKGSASEGMSFTGEQDVSGVAADLMSLKNLGPDDANIPTADDHYNVSSIKGLTRPGGDTTGDMLKSVESDIGPKQNLTTLGPEEYQAMLSMNNAELVAKVLDSDLGRKGQKYQDLGMLVTMLGALTGLPSIATSGLLLRNKGSKIISSLVGPVNEATARMASEYGDMNKERTASESLSIGKTIEEYGKNMAKARLSGKSGEVMTLENELRTYLQTMHKLNTKEIDAAIQKARSTTLSVEEELAIRGGGGQIGKASADLVADIEGVKRGAMLPERESKAVEFLKDGNYAGAVAIYGSQFDPAITGKMPEDIFNMMFSLEEPIALAEAGTIANDDIRSFQRTGPIDNLLSKLFGKEPSKADVLQKGNITKHETNKFNELKYADPSAPIIRQANQILYGMIKNGAWRLIPDGGKSFVVTINGEEVQLVNKFWRPGDEPSMDQLYAALDMEGFHPNFERISGALIEALR